MDNLKKKKTTTAVYVPALSHVTSNDNTITCLGVSFLNKNEMHCCAGCASTKHALWIVQNACVASPMWHSSTRSWQVTVSNR